MSTVYIPVIFPDNQVVLNGQKVDVYKIDFIKIKENGEIIFSMKKEVELAKEEKTELLKEGEENVRESENKQD